ncbi:YggS family pyridoxal phosphate enzyme [Halothiobacillus diazotrophicus]|uniref:Pyridoxal phosphate homeostasis protein n=1 Tax=Halothiobacillus diazotrophicus TaxID=1860122 RepID=A0A191ZGU8_9GAMM|nr:YggS family pyridoxal phosphate-dependent enzyme [Halothiobacillus diazotrophicus]ANJ67111.1 YggS family pyridoxal phosphate enzyme [Halothiobacillus diazotrophicus]
MNSLSDRYDAVRARIAEAAQQGKRSATDVRLLAVSKGQPADALGALATLGQRDFAESYVQEALAKQVMLAEAGWLAPPLIWHFIGPIQSNKTRAIATHFSWVHSVDRAKIAQRLNDHRPDDLPPLKILIEVNMDREGTKAGVDPDAVADLAAFCRTLPRLQLMGLMTIPAPGSTGAFARLAALNVQLNPVLPELSMGMSDDFEAAIMAGSTQVRIGSAVFGARRMTPNRATFNG